ncbi:sialate O-acetylesterase [Pseudoalteromonas sp. ASV78]|uniref:sialate O-acetylesterase n=1 Tax=Pseudoalteromonas sp. ASV78 TaxID=3397851 RepID=UPI0039FB9DA5
MSGYFQLVARLEEYTQALSQILAGDENTSVSIDGEQNSSIKKAIADQFLALKSMANGRVAFETVAQMYADLNHSANTLAEVWNDAENNNGLYGKLGSAGSGSWQKSPYDNIEQFNQSLNNIQTSLAEFEPSIAKVATIEPSVNELKSFNQHIVEPSIKAGLKRFIGDKNKLVPLIVDEQNKVLLGVDAESADLIASGIDSYKYRDSLVTPIVVDQQGKAAIAVEKQSGRTIMDLHDKSLSPALNRFGLYKRDIKGVAFAIADKDGKIAFAIDDDGEQIRVNFEKCAPIESKTSTDVEINHIVFYGQSLSLGAAGQPAISLEQPYSNLTFEGGPRSDFDELLSLKPLVEDNLRAPDGGANRGETICSGAANYITELLQIENGMYPDTHNYSMLCSTAGHGGYRIDQLEKGSEWYPLLVAHATAGFNLSQADNKTYAVQALGWVQGEADQSTGSKTFQSYFDALVKLQSDFETDAIAITGQVSPIPLITYQLATYVSRGTFNVTLAQLAASEQSENIILAAPTYQLIYSDGVHLNNIGYKWLGHYFAKAYKRQVYEGRPWKPLSPLKMQVQNKLVLIDFHVPVPPLVIDTDTLPETTDFGFTVYENDIQIGIDSVDVVSCNQVKLTLSQSVINPVVRYGLDNIAPGLNHTDGGSGNLRDSDKLNWSYGGKDYPLYNWCVMFEK